MHKNMSSDVHVTLKPESNNYYQHFMFGFILEHTVNTDNSINEIQCMHANCIHVLNINLP